jgi:hypothetical protein
MSLTENLVTSVRWKPLYDAPPWVAVAKETDTLIAPYRTFIELAPYLTLATIGADGVDCSPWRRSGLCSNPGRQDDFDPQPEWQQSNREPA